MEPGIIMDETNDRREARRRRILENSESRLRMITSRRNPGETEDAMDETNVRREARRLRILENSESRLHKIIGRQNLNETKADNKPLVKNDGFKSSLEECTVGNGTCNIENNRNLHYTAFNEDKYERFHTSFNEDKHDKLDGFLLRNTNDRNMYFSEEVVDEKSMSYTHLSYHINLIVLAAIVNILLVLKLDDWFGKAIFIPYLVLMVGRLYNFEKLQETKCSNLINVVSTVILLKIKPDLICKFKALLILCRIIINDLFLYIFSFILMHYVITICYYFYNDLMLNYS